MRKKKIVASVAVAAVSAVGWAAPASASEYTFLQALNNDGILIYDTGQALVSGWAICSLLDEYTGDVVVEAFYEATTNDVPDRYTAGIWVVNAVEQLCPWHDHRGQLISAV